MDRDSETPATSLCYNRDREFADLVLLFDLPIQVLWINCGNTSDSQFQRVCRVDFLDAMGLLMQGETIVEITRR